MDNSEEIKPRSLNKGKLNLNQRESHDTFAKETSHVFIDNLTRKILSDSEECNCDHKSYTKTIQNENPDKLILSHLNINSTRNKFELLINQIKGTAEVLMMPEIKIDDSFPTAQFLIDGFSQPYGEDQNSSGSRIMLYVRENIASNLLKIESLPVGFYVELKLQKEKWLISCSYNPHKNAINNHLETLSYFYIFIPHRTTL